MVGITEQGKNKLALRTLKADTSILGPTQLDAQIALDENIQNQINSLNVTGAKVTKKMIVIPVGNTILYIEPIYQTLINDMKLFKITKSDGTPNKNKFMNLLFQNYYLDYVKETESIISNTAKLMKKYNMNNPEFASELAMELYDYKHQSIDTYYNESLTFYLSEENEFIFETFPDFIPICMKFGI